MPEPDAMGWHSMAVTGWTLQELLAPSSVEFFSREGKRLGDKKSLEVQVQNITGIAVRALRANSLSEFSVDERMSWATNRRTTIDEDQVYCLLGIFDIYLPLIYGEGKANAFRRLRREIHQSGVDSLNLLPYASALRQHEKSEQGTLEHPLLHSLAGHRKYVRCIAFSLDGKRLASGSGDCTVRLWDVATGSTLQELEGHTALVEGVAFSPDVSGSRQPRKMERVVYHVSFSPDGKQLASGQWNGMVRLWDVKGSALQTLETAHEGYVSDVAFSPDGKWLALASGGGIIKLWEVAESVRESALQTLKGHDRYVQKVTFSPDSKRLVSAGADGTIRLWDVETGAMLQMTRDDTIGPWNPFIGTRETVTVIDVAFSGDGKQLVSASENGTIKRWDLTREAREVRESTIGMHKSRHSVVVFSPDLKRLASIEGSALTIQLWDALKE
ncbi:WD40-repeat-containing domain protein [Hyaloscypha sp. PMI_1271]|nr:WD40-repeat-containing domain protein [Hyaloscypha sp. PMI_1271]